jgi:hypothetical protein
MNIQWKSFFIGVLAVFVFNFLMAKFAGSGKSR